MYIGLEQMLIPALMGVSGLVGFYLGHRGLTGVKSDLNDVKTDVTLIKAKINPAVVQVTNV